MKLLILSMLLIGSYASAQINAADSTVQVVAYWNKNDVHTYNMSYEKIKVKGTDSIVNQKITYRVDIKVVDSTAKSYTVEWKYRDYVLNGADQKKLVESGASKILGLFQGQVVRFKTDENGSFTELLNWREIKKRQEESIKLLIKGNKLPKEIKNALDKLSTKETIQDYALKDVMQFHTFYGIALDLGKPVEQQIDAGTALTGPVKSETSLFLEEIDFENSEYVLKFLQSFEGEDLNKVVGTVLGELFPDLASKTDMSKIKLDNMDDFYGTVIHDTGWPVSSYYERVIRIGENQSIERRTIEFVE
jgi:hypothetical protein